MAGETFTMAQYDFIYNILSFALAAMGASTVFFWFQAGFVTKPFKNAMLVSSLVTFIAMYHYFRIFNSFVEAHDFVKGEDGTVSLVNTGKPFNDAYRYVDWLLTVPLLLMELVLVMQLDARRTATECTKLGTLAGVMVILGYPGEINSDMSVRWAFWGLAMIPFLVIVYSLFVGLKDSVEAQPASARGLVSTARYITVLSWCTYPIVYIFPMVGFTGAAAATAIQVGYSVADVIAKPILGLVVWRIAIAKSEDPSTQGLNQQGYAGV